VQVQVDSFDTTCTAPTARSRFGTAGPRRPRGQSPARHREAPRRPRHRRGPLPPNPQAS